MATKLDEMTLDELRATHADLEEKHSQVTTLFRAVAQEINARENTERVRAKIEAMSPQEREQMKAELAGV